MPESFLIGLFAVFLGGCVQGCTGFGFAIVTAPFMMLSLPPATAVPMICLLSLVNSSSAVLHCREHLVAGLIAPLLLGGILGLPAGVALLTRVDGHLLKVLIGALMVVTATTLFAGWRRPVENQRVALSCVGLVSGFLSGSTSLSGPPVILFLSNQNTPKDTFRANILAYFAALKVATLGMFAFAGLMTREVIVSSAFYVPILLLATFVGVRMAQHVSESGFKRVAMGCAAIMGVVLVVQNIGAAF